MSIYFTFAIHNDRACHFQEQGFETLRRHKHGLSIEIVDSESS